jgi:3'-phosphoadenosine 5'-phosphosulfate sulfotransferase (PAPS reductase)/FAD synthetase
VSNKKSLYYVDEPTCISFSGGRTSAFMLHKVLEAHDGDLPDFCKVTFANTGKEMPQTLDFIRDCAEKWDVDIVWLERFARLTKKGEKNKYAYKTKEVNYESASRNGEPFAQLIKTMGYAPNPVARYCTKSLKMEAITDYLINICGFEKPYVGFIGIRADEVRRAAKMNGTIECGEERYLPLYLDGVTARDVGKFWSENDFDLNLPNNNGVTDLGNCDLCFLKAQGKRQSIIRERPELADWWIEQENIDGKGKGEPSYFRKDSISYKSMKKIALEQTNIFDDMFTDETIPCFCGD